MEFVRSPLQARSLNTSVASPHSTSKSRIAPVHENEQESVEPAPRDEEQTTAAAAAQQEQLQASTAAIAAVHTMTDAQTNESTTVSAPVMETEAARDSMAMSDDAGAPGSAEQAALEPVSATVAAAAPAPTPSADSMMTLADLATSRVTSATASPVTLTHHGVTAMAASMGGRVPGHRARTPARSILHTSGSNHASMHGNMGAMAAPSPAPLLAFSASGAAAEAHQEGAAPAAASPAAAAAAAHEGGAASEPDSLSASGVVGLSEGLSSSSTWARRSRVAFSSPQAVFYPEAAPPAVISAVVPAELAASNTGGVSTRVLMVAIPAEVQAGASEQLPGTGASADMEAPLDAAPAAAPEAPVVVHTVLSFNDEAGEDDDSASVESFETSMNSSILASWEDNAQGLETSGSMKRRAREQRRSVGEAAAEANGSEVTGTATRKRSLADRGDLDAEEEEDGGLAAGFSFGAGSRRSSLAPPSAKRARRGSLAPTPAMLAAAAAAAAAEEEDEDEDAAGEAASSSAMDSELEASGSDSSLHASFFPEQASSSMQDTEEEEAFTAATPASTSVNRLNSSINPLHVFSTLEAAAQAGFALAGAAGAAALDASTASVSSAAAAPQPLAEAVAVEPASAAPAFVVAAPSIRSRSLSLSPGAISSTVAMAAAAVEAATAVLPAGGAAARAARNAMVIKPNNRRFTIAGGSSRPGAPRARAASMGGPMPAPLLPPAASRLPAASAEALQEEEDDSMEQQEQQQQQQQAVAVAVPALLPVAAPTPVHETEAALDTTADGRRVGAFLRGLLNDTEATFASSAAPSNASTPAPAGLGPLSNLSVSMVDASAAADASPVMSPIIRQNMLGSDGDFTLSSFVAVDSAFPSVAAALQAGVGGAGGGFLRALAAEEGVSAAAAAAAASVPVATAPTFMPLAPAAPAAAVPTPVAAALGDSALALGPASPAAPSLAAWGPDVTVDAPTSLGSLLQAEVRGPAEAAYAEQTRTLGSLAGVLSEEVAAVAAAAAAPRPAGVLRSGEAGPVRPSRESLEFASLLHAEEAAAGGSKVAALPGWMQAAVAGAAPAATVAAPEAVVPPVPAPAQLQTVVQHALAPVMQAAAPMAAPSTRATASSNELKDIMARLRAAGPSTAGPAPAAPGPQSSSLFAGMPTRAEFAMPAPQPVAHAFEASVPAMGEAPAAGRAALEAAVARSPASGSAGFGVVTGVPAQPPASQQQSQSAGVSSAAASFHGLPGFGSLMPASGSLTGTSVLAAAFPALFGIAAAQPVAAPFQSRASTAAGSAATANGAAAPGTGFAWAPRASIVPAALRRSLGSVAAFQQGLPAAAIPAVAPPVMPPAGMQVTVARTGPLAAAVPSVSSGASSSLSSVAGAGGPFMTFADFSTAAGLRFLSDDLVFAEAMHRAPSSSSNNSSTSVKSARVARSEAASPAATAAVEALGHAGRRLSVAVPRGPLPAAFAAPSVPLPASTATGAAAAVAAEARARVDAKAAARRQSSIAVLARKTASLRRRSSAGALGVSAPLLEAEVEEDEDEEVLEGAGALTGAAAALAPQLVTQAVLAPERESLTWCAKTMQDVVRRDEGPTSAAIAEWAEEQPFIFTAVARANAILRDHVLATAAGNAPAEADGGVRVTEASTLLDNVRKLKALHETQGRVQYLDWRRTTATNLLQTLSYNTAALKAEAAALQDEEAELDAALAKMQALVASYSRAADTGRGLAEVAPALQASLVTAATAKADVTAAKAELAQATQQAQAADAAVTALQQAIAAEEEGMRREKELALAALAAEKDRRARGVPDPERDAALAAAAAASRAYQAAADAMGGWTLAGAAPGDAALRTLASEGVEGLWRHAAAGSTTPVPIKMKLKHADGSAHTVSFLPTLAASRALAPTAFSLVGLQVEEVDYLPPPSQAAGSPPSHAPETGIQTGVGGIREFHAAASRYILTQGLAAPAATPLRARLAAVSSALVGLKSLCSVVEGLHTPRVGVRFSQQPVEGADAAASEWVLAFDASHPARALKFRVRVRGLFSVWAGLAQGAAAQAVGSNAALVPEWLWVCGAPSPAAQASQRRRIEAALRALPATATLAELIHVVGQEVERIVESGAA